MRIRPTARVLIINPDNRLLLFQVDDGRAVHDNRPQMSIYWVTPGGGVEPGESFEQAAVRETFEETGIRVDMIGPCAFESDRVLHFYNESVRLREQFFLVMVEGDEVDITNFDADERSALRDHRWWSMAELEASEEEFVPANLVELVRPFLNEEED